MMTSREKLGFALGFAGVCLFGGTLPATRLAVTAFDPLFLTAARAVIAGCLGLATLLITRRSWPSRQVMTELVFTGLFTVAGFPALIALALTTVPASHGGVVLGVMPLGTAVAAVVLTHERPSIGFWLTSVIGGAIVLAFVFRRAGGIAVEPGDAYLLCAIAMGSLAYAMSGRLSGKLPGWEVISWQVALFLPLTVTASLLLWPAAIAPSPAAWAGLGYVSTVSMYFAFFVFNAAMAIGGIARVGQLMLMQPFVIVALAVPINGETFEPETVLFATAVVATVTIGQRMRVRRG